MLWEAMKTDLKREGRSEGKFESIKNLMHSLHCSIDQAMDLLQTPPQERQHYKDLLSKNA